MRLTATLLLLLVFFTSIAQKVVIKGEIVDENGKPLSYTSVLVMPGRHGTAADINGAFSIEVKKGDSLNFSRVGFHQFHYTVTRSGIILVELKKSSFVLGPVNGQRLTIYKQGYGPGGIVKLERLNNDTVAYSYVPGGPLIEEDIWFEKWESWPEVRLNGSSSLFSKGVRPSKVRKGGLMKLEFMITASGKVDSIKILQSLNKEVDRQVMVHLKNAFLITPAMQNGRPASVSCVMALRLHKRKREVLTEILTYDDLRY